MTNSQLEAGQRFARHGVRAARAVVTVLVAGALTLAAAQDDEAAAEAALRAAVNALQSNSYSFTYSIWPTVDATGPITGSGTFDAARQNWRYSVASDAANPAADRTKDGDWLVADGAMYHDTGAGWEQGGMDFTYMGISGAITPFAGYEFARMLGSPDDGALEPLQLVGTEEIGGVGADHYRFATNGLDVLGTGEFDAWISMEGGNVTQVVLQVTDKDGHVNVVTYTGIGEQVDVVAP